MEVGRRGQRNVRKPKAAKKQLDVKKRKGTEEGEHKTGTGSPGQEAHHQ